MAVALGARSSTLPLPTGQVKRAASGPNYGARAWPGQAQMFSMDAIGWYPAEVGPFVGETAFYLGARATCAQNSTAPTDWQIGNTMLSLADAAHTRIVDQTIAFGTMEQHGGQWQVQVIETTFSCAAGTTYWVQFCSGGGAGNYLTGVAQHLGLMAWTIGEGVY